MTLVALLPLLALVAVADETTTQRPAGSLAFQLFPSEAPPLEGELAKAHLLGSDCLAADPVVDDPISPVAQDVKRRLAELGLEYQFNQALTFAAIPDPRDGGSSTLGAYSFQLYLNWFLARDESGGAWVSLETIGGNGLGSNWRNRSPGSAIESLSEPGGSWIGTDIAVAELAGALSLFAGELAVIAGMVNQSNYLDLNTYAQSQFGQLLNLAFIGSYVLPLPYNDLGVGAQWQPVEWGYASVGFGTNSARIGTAPWRDVSSDDLSLVTEFGLVFDDAGGLPRHTPVASYHSKSCPRPLKAVGCLIRH